ncbi:MAG: 4Fe-4S dicluster domain-containing protein [Desulfurivibrionaceae bacterium]
MKQVSRRLFLKAAVGTATSVLFSAQLEKPVRAFRREGANILTSPVARNRLRPPGAPSEKVFAGMCIRCGRCVEVCPYRSIIPLDIKSGVHAGTPLIYAEKVPCYLCMKCVMVCPTGTLRDIGQEETRMGLAIINKHRCYSWNETSLCRTCYDVCPFKNEAIYLEGLKPVVNSEKCTGCGICTHACPKTADNGEKAINIDPVYAGL